MDGSRPKWTFIRMKVDGFWDRTLSQTVHFEALLSPFGPSSYKQDCPLKGTQLSTLPTRTVHFDLRPYTSAQLSIEPRSQQVIV